jgi:hypothetical protein
VNPTKLLKSLYPSFQSVLVKFLILFSITSSNEKAVLCKLQSRLLIHLNADPNPAFHLNADADPDPTFHFNVDPPDPAPHQSDRNL